MSRAEAGPAAGSSGAWPTRLVRDPCVVAALVAVAVRAVVARQTLEIGAGAPRLDSVYYLDWARDLAGGDLLGRGGTIGGGAFLLNPLYAYVIAPLTAVFGAAPGPVVAFQTLLAGLTAAFAAAAARRFAGPLAAWIAGLATALSAALVHLDGKVAVSGLAAFLLAGAVWALAPAEADEPPRRGRGPLAAGVWVGLSLLARPVALFALPFLAILAARRSKPGPRAAAVFLVPVFLAAGISFARNAAVSGEPVVFTAADGQNLHLGNNEAARRRRTMTSDQFRFGPVAMHEFARYRVAYALGHDPTRAEVSAWFRAAAIDEVAAHPAESLAWYATKLRWFAAAAERASSYSFDEDRAAAWTLRLAVVPTWVLVALAAASLVTAGALRRELALGPGAIVAAHVAATTLVFPLSHYRSPAIPALAVMAGVGVAAALRASRGVRIGGALVAVAVAVAGNLPPQSGADPEIVWAGERMEAAMDAGDAATADALASGVLARDPADVAALSVRIRAANDTGRFADARAAALAITALCPWDPDARLDAALAAARLGDRREAERMAEETLRLFPWSAKVHGWRGAILVVTGDLAGARIELEFALSRGYRAPEWALRAVRL